MKIKSEINWNTAPTFNFYEKLVKKADNNKTWKFMSNSTSFYTKYTNHGSSVIKSYSFYYFAVIYYISFKAYTFFL